MNVIMTMNSSYKDRLKAWRNGAQGFLTWLEDVKPRVPSFKGGYVTFQLTDREREEVIKALSGSNKTIIFCWPRRHGKTLIVALIILWRFTCFQTQTIVMIANSEKQATSTCFRLLSRIIKNTPFLKGLIGENTGALAISYPDLENIIEVKSQNDRSLFGQKINVCQVSELHAAFDDSAYQTLASSLGDSEDAICVIDSTTGSRLSPLFKLFRLWENGEDPTIYVSHIFYKDLQDALDHSPPWISRPWLTSRSKQMLPALFAQQHLNVWTSGSNSLFPEETIQKSIARYGHPVSKDVIPSLIGARKYVTGIGVDRAFGFSLHGDRTVVTCVLKTSMDDESHYWVLFQKHIPFSSGSGIKRAISECVKQYQVKNTVFESFNSQDLWSWALEQGYPAEVVHATQSKQIPAFQELYLIASEGRLHISEACTDLISEMMAFEYTITESGNPSFQHATGHHDDFIYSLCWSVWALRDIELSAYEVSGISCKAKGASPEVCFLMGNSLVPFCSSECQSFHEVNGLFKQHLERHPESELDIVRFYQEKVKNVGGVVYRW